MHYRVSAFKQCSNGLRHPPLACALSHPQPILSCPHTLRPWNWYITSKYWRSITMSEGWSELTTIRTQKYVIINWKVVVIQQLGNYFDYHRHLIMHRLHIAYTSKVYFAATSSPRKQTAVEQWKPQQRAWLHTRLYRRSRRAGTEGSGWARRLLRACNQLRFCTILTRAIINVVSWLTSSSCRRSSSSCWRASHPL